MPAFVEGPRHAVVTADDIGPIIQIVAWFLMVVMILSTLLRLMIRFTTVHVPGADDALVSIAMLLGVGEVIAVSLAVNDGLGTRPKLLTSAALTKVLKSIYASNILYILTIAFAKASTTLLIYRLANVKWHLTLTRVLAGIILMWTLAAVFGQAFQCTVPRPWDIETEQCISIPSFWDGIGAIDIVLDLCLIAMPALIVSPLQMPWGRKMIVVSGFAFRLCLCAAQIIRLVFLEQTNDRTHDFIYSTLGYTIATQCHTTLAVVAACIPALKPFMDRAASGLMGVSFSDRAGTYDISANGAPNGANGTFEMKPSSKNNHKGLSVGGNGGAGNSGSRASKLSSLRGAFSGRAQNSTQISTAASHSNGAAGGGHKGGVGESGAGSPVGEDYMIQKTMDWEVMYSDEARLNSVSQQLPIQHHSHSHQTSGDGAIGEAGNGSESGSAVMGNGNAHAYV